MSKTADYIPVREGAQAEASQRQVQRWRWIGGRWHVPSDLPEHQLKYLV